jgi:hypothetical protein
LGLLPSNIHLKVGCPIMLLQYCSKMWTLQWFTTYSDAFKWSCHWSKYFNECAC